MRVPIYKSRPIEPNPASFGGQRINNFIVMSEGFSNCYMLETPAGNIQINAGMGLEAPVHQSNFESLCPGEVKHLILTQGHVDHVGGVQYFREQHPGLNVVAQANNTEHQAYDARLQAFRGARSAFAFTEKFTQAIQAYAQHNYREFPTQDTPTPDTMFERRHTLELGGLKVELFAVPGAETNDSLIVWLPQHKICFTGNLFGCPFGHFPNLVTIRGDRYRDALTCAEAVQTVLDLGAELILYGHHAPVRGRELIDTELVALRDAIVFVHDETVKGMNNGVDMHTLMRDIELPPALEVGQGYGKVSWSVRAIWEYYAGWFQHRSTTELYSTPQTSINCDLVELAGGPEAMVERAQSKFAHMQCSEALYLLDIVLEQAPHNVEALNLAIDIHQCLLEESDNFWLRAWLNSQIERLRQGFT